MARGEGCSDRWATTLAEGGVLEEAWKPWRRPTPGGLPRVIPGEETGLAHSPRGDPGGLEEPPPGLPPWSWCHNLEDIVLEEAGRGGSNTG